MTDTEDQSQTSNPLDSRPVLSSRPVHDVAEALSNDEDAYGPEGIGRYMRHIRIQRGISIRDISNQIRIRPNQVEALEDGRVADLPGVVYSIGYIRAYAVLLGLNADEVVQRFKADSPATNELELGLPASKRENRLPRPIFALGILMVCAGTYGGWTYLNQKDKPPRVTDVPAHLAQTETPTQVVTGVESSTSGPEESQQASLDSSSASGADTTEQDSAANNLIQNTTPLSDNNVSDQEGVENVLTEKEPTDSLVPLPESTPASQSPDTNTVLSLSTAGAATNETGNGRQLGQAADSRISITARSDSYVQIKDANNTLFLQRVLRTGDIYYVPDLSGLTLVTSSAGGLQISVDGQEIAPLGDVNEIVQGVNLIPVELLGTDPN